MAAAPFILVLNCGSSSIKFALYEAPPQGDPDLKPAWAGQVQGIGTPGSAWVEGGVTTALALGGERPYHEALETIRGRAFEHLQGRELAAVAHRVVHGGIHYQAPVRMTAPVLAELRGLVPLAPLHQPFALEAMDILLELHPEIVQIACFDTGFHHTLPKVEQLLPLSHDAWSRGLRRYGFHGLSYEYISMALRARHGEAARGARTLVAHLGSGASLCALQDLRSVATTMGFSALDGLMMGTRTGAIDPGAVLYLLETEKLSPEALGHKLYHASGLLGVSGLSSDPRVLLACENDPTEQGERARDALALYVRRIVREAGALVAVLGGLDRLVFTAGVGEHSDVLRQRICEALSWLGLQLDPSANAAHAPVISSAASRVAVEVIPTQEEWVAALSACRLLRADQASAAS